MASTELDWGKYVDEQEKLSAKVMFLSYVYITGLTSFSFIHYCLLFFFLIFYFFNFLIILIIFIQ